jgi:enoyl-CoA hydratase/carnithine racemase
MSLTRERIDGVEIVRLDRPAARNAIDSALLDALLAAVEDARDATALVVSTTSTAALSAGADVREPLDAAGGVARMEAFARLYATLEAFPGVTLAVCVGNCVGAGAELAAGCDLRVGGDNLKLSWPGARLGVPVGPARLVPLVGLSRAKDWIYSGRVVGAEEALAAGFLHAVAPAAEAEDVALERARAVAAQPGVRTLKALFRELDAGAERVALENDRLVEFQRSGSGLPTARG